MTRAPTRPTPADVTTAIVAATRLTGESPDALLDGAPAIAARPIALAALLEAFSVSMAETCYLVGYASAGAARAELEAARSDGALREDWVDDVVGVLVSDRYGARAQ